eukprot:TRINITY_DN429_c0_g1_i2.p1 TRINITY_DN429_c0_g1~~TRINITY_DN429_c0_g1_i2.p1  ORF type:complete len:456 (+),score=83.84 TRINITY_DN429_c0_g1_i2:42-1370(+)
MGSKNLLLVLAVVLQLAVRCEGKGSAGSVSGGSYRSSRNGYYSRGHYYGYYPLYIGHARYGTRGHYSSDNARQAASIDNPNNKIFCQRDVRLDGKTYTSADEITFNSTRDCYIQMSTDNGSPKNEKILETALDVFQWKMIAGSSQVGVEMQQFNDKDDGAPLETSKFGVFIESMSSNGGVNSVDLNSLTWKSSNIAPADKPVFGYPRTTSRDNTRLLTIDSRGQSADGTVDITINYAISADFAEDPFVNHVFFRPSGMKMDITVSKFPGVTGTGGSGKLTFKIYLRAKSTLEQSYGKPLPDRFPTEYDSQKRMRIEIGKITDAEARGRNFFSWSSQVSQKSVCYQEGGSYCAIPSIPSSPLMCDNAANSVECAKARGLPGDWVLPFEIEARVEQNPDTTHLVTWSTTIGTYDVAEFTAVEPNSAATAGCSWLVLLAICLLFV